MDMGARCSSGNGEVCCCCWSRSFSSRNYDRFVSHIIRPSSGSKAPIWRQLWTKMKKEKKRTFYRSTSTRFAYDPYTYSQNFDQGLTWADPDDISRSFSARFAVPSRIFDDKDVLDV
ncbi:uncharacterized protein LOC113767725 [Coffea eugenioides]|uniref:uncharacterized protein LOC113767725 n=1 Tax=Coffea eugenioides TaxID=49369 RepID=UPI000F609759|nr:uncharacterized protein LOC113767725 [Coffea eugenioides]